jgi:hypothetical protein
MQHDLPVSIHVSEAPVTESEGMKPLLSKPISQHCVEFVCPGGVYSRGLIGCSSCAAMISRYA